MTAIETSLGYTAELHGSIWTLDLRELPILHGLSVLSRNLSERIVAQAKSERIDINVEHKIRARENPELLERFGVTLVKVCAEHECVRAIAESPAEVEHHLRALLGNLQRRIYREALLPAAADASSRALVADFSRASTRMPNRFVMEFVPAATSKDGGYLRITIEDPAGRRLDLASIEHVEIEQIENRNFIAGSTRIAQTWAEGLRREAERGRRSFSESRTPYSHLFRQLDRAGLEHHEEVAIQWGDAAMPLILEGDPVALESLLKRALLALEDAQLRRLLARGDHLRVDAVEGSVFVDSAQLGRVLNLSLGERRHRTDVEGFLASMPALAEVVRTAGPEALAGTSVFLVHHMTSEVLGLIAALRRLGCTDLTCLFVVYGGEAPASYLEAALGVPTDEFRALALVNVPSEDSVEGRYRLSRQYSRLEQAHQIERALERQGHAYLEAMRAAAIPTFLAMLRRAEGAGRRCVVVEDGGYLGPELQRVCLEDAPAESWLVDYGLECPNDGGDLRHRLERVWLGSVEHTRNGFDQLADLERQHGRLARPAFSIAVSHLKRDIESREVAVSLLNALENVLGAGGRVLSRRTCLVLGSRGNIGRHLMRELANRLEQGVRQLFGVDLEVPASGLSEVAHYAELPEDARRSIDCVLGVTGASVLSGAQVETWLEAAGGRELVLASGSTKTLEFTDVARWLDGLLQSEHPAIAGREVTIDSGKVTDARTGRVYGQRYEFRARSGGDEPVSPLGSLVFLANLTPINFLFYGVPTELIDEVLAQLLSVTLGLVERCREGAAPLALQAVDRDIDEHGRPLA